MTSSTTTLAAATLLLAAVAFLAPAPCLAGSWGYKGQKGPDHWPGVCTQGQMQSPIDVVSTEAAVNIRHMEGFYFHNYDRTFKNTALRNNGHTVVLTIQDSFANMPKISGGGLDGNYVFGQLHFHWGVKDGHGSEHTIDKKAYPMEMHIVHFKEEYGQNIAEAIANARGAEDTLAVLGVLHEVDTAPIATNQMLAELEVMLPRVSAVDAEADGMSVNLNHSLPLDLGSFYRYRGSLTTPGCDEIVIWTLFRDVAKVAPSTLTRLRRLTDGHGDQLVDNFRPEQKKNERDVHLVEVGAAPAAASPAAAMAVATAAATVALSRLLHY